MKHASLPLIFCLGFSTQAIALDHIETIDGGIITGVIKQVTDDTIILSTEYAGKITLQRDKIIGFTSEQPLSVRLNDGAIITGPVHHQKQGILSVSTPEANRLTQFQDIAESWSPADQDPELTRLEEAEQATIRKWSFEAGVDIAGKKGNSDEFGAALTFGAKLTGQDDTLLFYGSLDQAEQDGVDSSDEIILGAEYTSYSSDPWGWYVRAEVEKDDFEDLRLRTLLGTGLNYRVFHEPEHSLELRSGLGYRHENFNDGTTEQSPTLDFGLAHDWQFASWGRMTNHVTYTPAIADFTDYLITHDSGIEIPLGFSDYWQLRLGLRHKYKSIPVDDREHLDTSYYSRLQMNWQ